MAVAAKVLLMITFLTIFFQDLRDREVYAFLFPLIGILGSYLFFTNSNLDYFLLSLVINLGVVTIVVLATYCFSKYILKKEFLSEALGLGDILFFIAFALCFPTVAFVNFLVFSFLFTFVLHLSLNKILSKKSGPVPLAGHMSLFLVGVYFVNWVGLYDSLYLL